MPVEWFSDDVLPVAFRDVELFIAPIYDLSPGIGHLETVFGRTLSGARMENRENPGGFVTKCAGGDVEIPDIKRTRAVWDNPRKFQ
jgi:hypothetical protein